MLVRQPNSINGLLLVRVRRDGRTDRGTNLRTDRSSHRYAKNRMYYYATFVQATPYSVSLLRFLFFNLRAHTPRYYDINTRQTRRRSQCAKPRIHAQTLAMCATAAPRADARNARIRNATCDTWRVLFTLSRRSFFVSSFNANFLLRLFPPFRALWILTIMSDLT